MRVSVIGMGVVGKATADVLQRLGHQVVGTDCGEPIGASEVYFVCTPEDAVESAIITLSRGEVLNELSLVVIRSTTLPGTTKGLAEKYHMHICHQPEFLREATLISDELNPWRIVIGECCQQHGRFLEQLWEPLRCPIIRVDTVTSEIVKLACNVHLATLISFWNEICEICLKLGVNSHVVGKVSSLDPRISSYGATMHGKPFGGRCLPKDLRRLIEFSHRLGCKVPLLGATQEVNEEKS